MRGDALAGRMEGRLGIAESQIPRHSNSSPTNSSNFNALVELATPGRIR